MTACTRTRIALCVRANSRNDATIQILLDGDPVDTTGATVTAEARRDAADPAPAISAVVSPVDAADGIWTLSWPGPDVATLLGADATWTGSWVLDVLPAGGAADEDNYSPAHGPFDAVIR
jgi:hypothetical protein